MVPQYVPVWDRLTRWAHWLLVLSVSLAWLSTVVFGWTALHRPAGYAAIGIVIIRSIWGFAGGHYAKFRQFVYRPAQVHRYVLQVMRGAAPRYLGHNPLGGWMVIALLAAVLCAGITGWMFITDRFWGMPRVHFLHNLFAWIVLALAMLHLVGVIHASRAHRENLVAAMFNGKKLRGKDDKV